MIKRMQRVHATRTCNAYMQRVHATRICYMYMQHVFATRNQHQKPHAERNLGARPQPCTTLYLMT